MVDAHDFPYPQSPEAARRLARMLTTSGFCEFIAERDRLVRHANIADAETGRRIDLLDEVITEFIQPLRSEEAAKIHQLQLQRYEE